MTSGIRASRVSDVPNHRQAERTDQEEGVGGALQVGALHEACGLVGGEWRAGDARTDELPSELLRHVWEADRPRFEMRSRPQDLLTKSR